MPDDRIFRYEMLKNGHVNMIYNNPIDVNDRNPLYTLVFAPEKITGPFWFGSKETNINYWFMYHEALQRIYSMGTAEDDKAVMVYCYTHQKDETKLWKNTMLRSHGWYARFFFLGRL